jgi:hypothetical protein
MFFFRFCPANRALFFQTKNPRLIGQSRVCRKFIVIVLENFTHDAKGQGAAMPNGHASLDRLRALFNGVRVCHFLTGTLDSIFGRMSRKVRGAEEVRGKSGSYPNPRRPHFLACNLLSIYGI